MFERIKDQIVCKEFNPKGIYKAIINLEDDVVINCSKQVIAEFEAFVATNYRIRKAVNNKRITLVLFKPRKTLGNPKPIKSTKTKDINKITKEIE